ncbi:MAG TPA: DUF5327 family protein [Bacillota bacterium]
MGVSYDTILQKMFHELQQAKRSVHQREKMSMHIRHLQLLGDLLVTNDSSAEVKISEDERRVSEQTSTSFSNNDVQIDHDEANGESIFDF